MYDAIVVGELDKLALLDTEAHGEELVVDVTQCEPLPLTLEDALPHTDEDAEGQRDTVAVAQELVESEGLDDAELQ